jgi:hypothetical protein
MEDVLRCVVKVCTQTGLLPGKVRFDWLDGVVCEQGQAQQASKEQGQGHHTPRILGRIAHTGAGKQPHCLDSTALTLSWRSIASAKT